MTREMKVLNCFMAALGTLLLLMLCFSANAQVLPEYSAFPASSIGAQAGTQGLGLQGSYKFLKAFDVRAGFDVLSGINFKFKGRDLQFTRSMAFVIVDWQPHYGQNDWFSRKWFISAGYGAYFSNSIYRQAYNSTLPDYTEQLSKSRPYIGTGLGNIPLSNAISLRLDLGEFIPTSKTTTTYDNSSGTITNGLQGILPGLNIAATFYFRF